MILLQKMKKFIVNILFSINLIFIVAIIPTAVMAIIDDSFYHFLKSDNVNAYSVFINIPIILFWFYNLHIWVTKDKDTNHLLLILFFNIFYDPFYYRKAEKNHWV
jgi:hypothetical protein